MQDQVALGAKRSPTPVKGGIARVPWLAGMLELLRQFVEGFEFTEIILYKCTGVSDQCGGRTYRQCQPSKSLPGDQSEWTH